MKQLKIDNLIKFLKIPEDKKNYILLINKKELDKENALRLIQKLNITGIWLDDIDNSIKFLPIKKIKMKTKTFYLFNRPFLKITSVFNQVEPLSQAGAIAGGKDSLLLDDDILEEAKLKEEQENQKK